MKKLISITLTTILAAVASPAVMAAPTYDHDLGRFATAEISPVDVVRDSTGKWYVMDEGLECIKVYSSDLTAVVNTIFTCGIEGNDSTHIRRARGIGIDPNSDALWIADTPNNRVLKVNKWGAVVFSTRAETAPGGPLVEPWDVAVDDAGYGYVVDDKNRVVKLTPTGAFSKQFGSTGSGPGQMRLPIAITYSAVPSPAVYITDARNYRVSKFGLYGFYKGSFGSFGTGNGQFTKDARGVAVDASGRVYAADVGRNRIVRFNADGTSLPSLGNGLPYSRSGPLDLFYGARGLFISGNTLAVSDMWNYRVLLWTLDGSSQGQIGGTPPPLDGHVEPRGIAMDAVGNVYVSDYWHQYIQKFEPDGTLLARWGIGRGSDAGTLNLPGGIDVDDVGGYLYIANREQNSVDRWNLSDGSYGGRFYPPGGASLAKAWPRDVAVNSISGDFYVADEKNRQVDIISSLGTVRRVITHYDTDNKPLGTVTSVALDTAGNLYVADLTAKKVHVYTSGGDWIRTFATRETPSGLLVRDGVVWVVSWRIAEYTTTGTFITHWGSPGTADNQLSQPYGGIAIDGSGNIYLADTKNHRVKVFKP